MRILFAIIATLGLIALSIGQVTEARAGADFRIIALPYLEGHLVFEVQHFKPDGSHWFYENYTFQGREQFKQPRVTDQLGNSPIQRMFIKSDGRVAPTRQNHRGQTEHYLPPGEQWLRQNRPHLNQTTITSVIQGIHAKRLLTGWTRGQQRLTTHPLSFSPTDASGADALRQRFSGLKETAYRIDPQGALIAYNGSVPPVDSYISSEWGTVSTFFPDPNPESTSVDGEVRRTGANETFATIRAGSGSSNDSGASHELALAATTTTDQYSTMRNIIQLYDTTALGSSAFIQSATLEIVCESLISDDFNDSISLVTSTPASSTSLTGTDYLQMQDVKQAADITLAGLTCDSATFNVLTLNSTGRGNISTSGVSKFALRLTSIAENTEPTWGSGESSRAQIASADVVDSNDRPRLIVTHISITIAVTGTIGDGATEAEVRDGGGTIILTVTGDTWDDPITPFRSGIINGLVSGQSETNGWNADVTPNMSPTSVVRTSSTVVTITFVTADLANYEISLGETITATVPGAALDANPSDVVATPTITIEPVTESMAVSGSLGASGGTAAELRGGGEAVLLTLTNANWQNAGANFNAQRQPILNNCISNLSDQAGWNARRDAGDFVVTDVARTSATIVTITLSASTNYAIPTTETITCTAPNAAMLLIKDLTGSPSFNIVPGFALTGNRVSAAINLSSVTDVALCGFGWTVELPTNTAATFETSVNGGTAYSTAVNGNCPAGITIGASLAAITDFRVRVTLTTTDSTVTPLVTAMALVIQDTTGQALYYQLNTTPGVTIEDRSANTNAGTMSFPVSTAGVGVATGAMQSTRETISLDQTLTTADVVTPVSGVITAKNLFTQSVTGSDTQTLPFDGIVRAIATGADFPVQAVWIIGIGVLAIFTGAALFMVTNGSFLFAGIGMATVMGVGAGLGAVGLNPGWTVLLSAVMMLAFVLLRQRGSVPI